MMLRMRVDIMYVLRGVYTHLMASVFILLLSASKSIKSLPCRDRRCPEIPIEPVCGTNMKSYNNLCKMQEDACQSGLDIRKAYDGLCVDCMDTGKVTQMVMNFYFNDKDRRSPCKKFVTSSGRDHKGCLSEKFDEFDSDRDGLLRFREATRLFKDMEFFQEDKRCVRNLLKTCDSDKNKKITKREMEMCLIAEELTPCERQERTSAAGAVFRCRPNGDFDSQQCVDSVCYCTAQDGNIIIHFELSEKEDYNCDQIRSAWENGKRSDGSCSEDELDTLVAQFVIEVEKEMIQSAPGSVKGVSSSKLSELHSDDQILSALRTMHLINKLLHWKFKVLDSDGLDHRISYAELQPARETLINLSPKCGVVLLEQCDANKDNYFSKREWRLCFGFRKVGALRRKTVAPSTIPAVTEMACPPIAFCDLSCISGLARDENGCLLCVCKHALSVRKDWLR